jgi:hypothetical protein
MLEFHLVRQFSVVEEFSLGVEAEFALVFGSERGFAVAVPYLEGVAVPHALVVGPGGVRGDFEGDVTDVGDGAGVGHCWGFRLRDKIRGRI